MQTLNTACYFVLKFLKPVTALTMAVVLFNLSGYIGGAKALAQGVVALDAGQNLSESGGDDLAAMRNVYASASYPESNGGLESSWPFMSQIGAKRVRLINALNDCNLDGAGNLTGCQRLNWALEWVKRYGLTPHVIVGQRRPDFLAGPASQWPESSWGRYQDFADKVVRYIAAQYDGGGFNEIVIEASNELDITGNRDDLWTLADPGVSQGDLQRYNQALGLYRIWSRAVDRVAGENPGKKILAGGPAMGGQSLFLRSNDFWHERFVRDVAREGLRLDVVTHHFYGDVLRGWSGVAGSDVRSQMQRIKAALNANGRSNASIMISEYGPSENTNNDRFGRINFSHEGAAWAAAFIREAVGGGATSGSFLIVRDNFGGDSTGNPALPSYTHMRNGVEYPKPEFNAFRMFSMLPGGRRLVTTDAQQPNIGAVGSADSSTAGLLVYNYNYKFDWNAQDYSDQTRWENVTPVFRNMPFSGDVLVERYLIDYQTSNLAEFLDRGQTPPMDQVNLEKVEQYSATVSNGALDLPQRSVAPSAVSLWIVRRTGQTATPAAAAPAPAANTGSASVAPAAPQTAAAPDPVTPVAPAPDPAAPVAAAPDPAAPVAAAPDPVAAAPQPAAQSPQKASTSPRRSARFRH